MASERAISRSSTSEDVSQSRRSSLTKSATRLQSKLGAIRSKRKLKRTLDSDNLKPDLEGTEYIGTTEDSLLLLLPIELQLQMFSFLDITAVFALRATSRSLALLILQNQRVIAREYISNSIPVECKNLCAESQLGIYYVYQLHHAHIVAAKVADLLADFVETEFLQNVGGGLNAESRARFVSLATPPLLTLSHYYTTIRLWMLQYFPQDAYQHWQVDVRSIMNPPKSPTERDKRIQTELFCDQKCLEDPNASGSSLHQFATRILQQYEWTQLESAYHMEHFLYSTLKRVLRHPTYLNFIERLPLTGSTIGNMAAKECVQPLLLLGGLDKAVSILSQKAYNARFNALAQWRKSLLRAESIDWVNNWKAMVYGPFGDDKPDEATNDAFDPPASFNPSWPDLVRSPAVWILAEDGKAVEPPSTRVFVSNMIGYDILRGTRWAQQS